MSNNLVLIDTSVWIPFLRKSPPPVVKDEVEHLLLHADRHFDLMAEDTDLNVRSLISIG